MFTDKTLLITGGTGSFGNAVLNRFLETDIKLYADPELLTCKRSIMSTYPV